jgi:hypothetical protein
MPNKKKPELLPGIKYAPRGDAGGRGGGDYEYYNRANSYNANPEYAQNFGGGGGMPPTLPPINYNPIGGEVPPPRNEPPPVGGQYPEFGPRADGYVQHPASTPNWMTSAGAGSYADSRAQEVAGGAPQYIQDAFRNYYQQNPNGAEPTYPNREGGVADGAVINREQPAATGGNNPKGAAGTDQAARLVDATNKNQALTEKAKAAGDDKEMKRLDEEWARLTSTPLYKQMYGGSDAMEVKNRLINSYMQPDNEAAEPSFERAHARMVTDDWWAEEMTKAGAWGDQAQNDRLWAEHWHAMNKGGRDPLEGNPQAIQNLEAKKEELKRMNQQSAYDMLQQWQAKSGNL